MVQGLRVSGLLAACLVAVATTTAQPLHSVAAADFADAIGIAVPLHRPQSGFEAQAPLPHWAPVSVSSALGQHFESADRLTKLTRRAVNAIDAVWTVQQAAQSCGLVWFNQSRPAVSEYELRAMHGAEGCAAGGAVWVGLFEFEDSAAVDALFDSVCAGAYDLSWLPLGEHIALRHDQFELATRNVLAGAALPRLAADAATFMIVRNSCGNPVNVELGQRVSLRVMVPLRAVVAAIDVLLLLGAAAGGLAFAWAAAALGMVLRSWWQTWTWEAPPVEASRTPFCIRMHNKRQQQGSTADSVAQPLLLAVYVAADTGSP